MSNDQVKESKGWQTRYTMVCLCAAATFICYIDRVNISVAIIPMAEEFGWDQATRGLVLSAFFVGYLLTQIAGGWLADRLGGKLPVALGPVRGVPVRGVRFVSAFCNLIQLVFDRNT